MMIILTIAVLIVTAMAFCVLIVIQLASNKQEYEKMESNYISLIVDVMGIRKKLGLQEDCTIDEIHNEINRIKQENKALKQKRKGISIWI